MPFHVQYEPALHKGKAVIFLRFEKNEVLNERVKKLETARRSQSRKSWYVADTVEYRTRFGIALQKESGKQLKPANTQPETISEGNKEQLQHFLQILTLKAYSPNTIRTYRNEFSIFLSTLKNTAAESLTTQRVKDYLEYCH